MKTTFLLNRDPWPLTISDLLPRYFKRYFKMDNQSANQRLQHPAKVAHSSGSLEVPFDGLAVILSTHNISILRRVNFTGYIVLQTLRQGAEKAGSVWNGIDRPLVSAGTDFA